MRYVLALAAASGLLLTPAALAARVHLASASGDITYLSPWKIKVAHLSCTIPSPAVTAAAAFVIGDSVTIRCQRGHLRTIKYVPPTLASTAQRTADLPSPASPTSAPKLSGGVPSQFGVGSCTYHQDANGGTITTCYVLVG